MKTFIWYFILLLMLISPLSATDEDELHFSIQRALLYQEGDLSRGIRSNYYKAFRIFRDIALIPNHPDKARACFYVGLYYDMGWGIYECVPLAVHYYRKALDLGFEEARVNLTVLLEFELPPSPSSMAFLW